MYKYKIVQAELWGNAKEGFNTNNWHTLQTITREAPLTDRWLLRIVRDLFEGRSFAWSENKSTFMSRKGIEVDSLQEVMMYFGGGDRPELSAEIHYRGHYVGEVQVIITEERKQCSS